MPSLDLLLLPLLGGFIFVSQWYPTKYRAFRSAGNRLVFTAAIAGAIFLFLATWIITATFHTIPTQTLAIAWHDIVPFPHSGKAAVSFLIGALLWMPLNFLGRWLPSLSDDAAVNRAILRKRDPLELLLRTALGRSQTIAITLKNNKVYIGRITANLNPAFDIESIHVILQRSGHRDPVTQKLTIDVDYDKTHTEIREEIEETFYRRVIEAVEKNPKAASETIDALARERMEEYRQIQNYEIVILASEIVSVNYFDLALYKKHFEEDVDVQVN